MIRLAGAIIGSYLVGSLPTGYWLVKWRKGIDVRAVGSGSVGATNVTRAAGAGAGRVVFLFDVAKGLLAVRVLAPWLAEPVTPAVQLACGLAAVVGHTASVFLKFQGGKGVATTIGVVLGTEPLTGCVFLAVWLAGFLLWRYVSVGSLAAAVSLPVTQWLTRRSPGEILYGVALALLIVARHQANIRRLLQGTEPRFRKSRFRKSS